MKYTLFINILILSNLNAFSQKGESPIKNDTMSTSEYINYGIKVNFEGSIDIIKNNFEEKNTYFYKSIETIRFDENNRVIDYNSQHLISETIPFINSVQSLIDTNDLNTNYASIDTTLAELSSVEDDIPKEEAYSSLHNSFSYFSHYSSLYIMPKIPLKEFEKEISSYVNNHPPFQVSEQFEAIEIGANRGYKWRIQSGKTRLDHYIFFGKEYNYLFVSSPYGSNGLIEKTLLRMELL